MKAENLLEIVQKIKIEIETVENELEKIKRQKELENNNSNKKINYLKSANIMREAFSYFKQGFNSWEVAEKIKDNFSSVWDAYYFISKEKHQENVRFQYARAFLVSTLAKKTDMTYSEIGKIAGYSRERCCQIVHTFKN